MRVLAENMAYLLRNLEASEAANVALPEKSEECGRILYAKIRTSEHGSAPKKERTVSSILSFFFSRAQDGIRTRDPRLGKAILHH